MSNQAEGLQGRVAIEGLTWDPLPASIHSSPAIGLAAKAGDEGHAYAHSGQTATAHAGDAIPSAPESHRHGTFNMTRKKEKMEMPVCTRVSLTTFRALEVWCDNSFRKRSEVVGIVLERIVEMLSQQQCIEQPVEEFVRRLRVGPHP
ncbi:MAG: hypothetical protein ACRD18_16955 [Terriglobia bacterium]